VAPDPSKNLRALPEQKRRIGMLSQGEVNVAQAHAEACVIMKWHVNEIYMRLQTDAAQLFKNAAPGAVHAKIPQRQSRLLVCWFCQARRMPRRGPAGGDKAHG